jgi:predicted RNA-binding Zn-ribbon protein involved in translation (DUF1610 family)
MSILKRADMGGKVVMSETLLQCPRCGCKDIGDVRKCPKCGADMVIQQSTSHDEDSEKEQK